MHVYVCNMYECMYLSIHACICVTRHTGTLGELVGSHTKVVIYPTYAILCERL